MIKKAWNYIGEFSGLCFLLYTMFVFLTAVVIDNSFSKAYLFIAVLFIVPLCIIICPRLIRLFSRLSISNKLHTKEFSNKINVIIRIAFFVIPLSLFLFYYFVYFPGGFSSDSITQYSQTINNQYNDWHPVMQTLFAFKLPLLLTGGWIGSIVLFQIIILSGVIAYSINVVYNYTNIKIAAISLLFIILNPQIPNIAMYPFKDVSFAMGALLLLSFSVEIYFTNGKWAKKISHLVVFILVASLTILFRHNAILFVIPLCLVVLFYLPKRKIAIILLSVLVTVTIIKIPVYSIIGVESPSKRQIETLGLPMTVIGAVVKYNPEALDEETKTFAYKVAPKEVWEEKYEYGTYNLVKSDKKTNNDIIEEYGTQKIIKMMFSCVKNAPKESIIGLIKLTEAVYTVTDKYYITIRPIAESNNLGIEQRINNKMSVICRKYSDFTMKAFPHIFMFLGVLHFVLITSFLAKCKRNNKFNIKRFLFISPVFVYNYGTTLLLTGVEDSVRFFCYTFLLMPLLITVAFKDNEKEKIVKGV